MVTWASSPDLAASVSPSAIAARAARIALVLCDNDGVLTDGTVYVSERGEELKAYSLRDGMGVERLRERGIATAIITRESSAIVRRRAEKLALPHVWVGVRDKGAALPAILAETGLALDQLAYIGDDINDLSILDAIRPAGLTAAPADAMPDVKRAVHLVCEATGGRGAFREFAEWILRHRPVEPGGVR
jgi:3-deoxy-D-manno-octulosonate 8-phosphate phosphatase (KDO 8-P phosphatase)